MIGSNSLRSSVSSERAPLEEIRRGTRTRSDYYVGTDFALGWAFSATVPERVRTVAGSAAVTIRRTVVAACGAILSAIWRITFPHRIIKGSHTAAEGRCSDSGEKFLEAASCASCGLN